MLSIFVVVNHLFQNNLLYKCFELLRHLLVGGVTMNGQKTSHERVKNSQQL